MSPRPTSLEAALLLGGLCLLLAAAPARALKTDKQQPINIHADHGDFKADPKNASDGTGIYTGHVVITQGSIVLQGDKAVLHIVNNDLSIADVTGNPVTFVQQPDVGEPMHGESQELTYDAARNQITLITNAKLSQAVIQAAKHDRPDLAGVPNVPDVPGERLMTADVIHYNTDTQHVIAKGGDEQQRVHVSFPPKVPASATVAKPTPAQGRKGMIVPPPGTRAPITLGAPPQAPAPASTPAPAATTERGQRP